MTDIGKETVDSFMASTRAATKHLETIREEVEAFNKAQFKEMTTLLEAVKGAKSVHEAIELQLGFARHAFEAGLRQASRLGMLGFDMLQEGVKRQQAALEPMTKPVLEAAEKISKTKAA